MRGLSHSYFAPYGRWSKIFIIIIMVSRIGRAWVIQIFGFSWSKSYTFQKLEEQNFATFVLVNVAKLSHPVLFLFALSSFHWTGHHRGEQTQELRMYLWRKWAKWKGLPTKYYDYEQSVLQYIAKQQQCYDGQIESISCVWAEKGLSAFSNQVTSSLLLIGFVVRVERQGWGSF